MEGRLGRTQVWRLKTWARDPHRHEANCVAVLGALEVGRSCALRGAGQRGLCVEPGGPALRPGRWVPPRPAGAAGLTPLTASPAARRRDSRRGPALSQGGVAGPWGRRGASQGHSPPCSPLPPPTPRDGLPWRGPGTLSPPSQCPAGSEAPGHPRPHPCNANPPAGSQAPRSALPAAPCHQTPWRWAPGTGSTPAEELSPLPWMGAGDRAGCP